MHFGINKNRRNLDSVILEKHNNQKQEVTPNLSSVFRNGQIKEYVMRNDGNLVTIAPGTNPDFSTKLDFFQYCIFALNDPKGTTHLIGKDFTILGSFAYQQQCENMNGLLFPTTRKGVATGCVFFRKSATEFAPSF